MQKSIKKTIPFKIDFGWDLGGFGEGKWRQVGSKIVSETDVNFEQPIFTKTNKNHSFSMILLDLGRQVGIENR